jgi:CheY-like chemotaxis protein
LHVAFHSLTFIYFLVHCDNKQEDSTREEHIMTDVNVRQPTLVVADDDADVRAILVDALRAGGHSVEWEPCGAGLLSRLSRVPGPDLVVTDLKMPWLDGLEVLERAERMGLHVPGILCTGFFDHEVRERAERLDVPILQKPLDLARLRQAVSRGLDEALWTEPEHDGYEPIRRRTRRDRWVGGLDSPR